MKTFKQLLNEAKKTNKLGRALEIFGVSTIEALYEKFPFEEDEDFVQKIVEKLGSEYAVAFMEESGYRNVSAVRLPNNEEIIVTNDYVFADGWIDEKQDWLESADVELIFDYDERKWSNDFWSSVGPGSVVWHNTSERAWEGVQSSGVLEASNNTRGLTNRNTGRAVFVTTDPDSAAYGSYGSVIIAINLYAMKRDNYMPMVQEESPFTEYKLRSALANLIGYDRYSDHEFTSDGISPDTLVIHGDIPLKYIERDD